MRIAMVAIVNGRMRSLKLALLAAMARGADRVAIVNGRMRSLKRRTTCFHSLR